MQHIVGGRGACCGRGRSSKQREEGEDELDGLAQAVSALDWLPEVPPGWTPWAAKTVAASAAALAAAAASAVGGGTSATGRITPAARSLVGRLAPGAASLFFSRSLPHRSTIDIFPLVVVFFALLYTSSTKLAIK